MVSRLEFGFSEDIFAGPHGLVSASRELRSLDARGVFLDYHTYRPIMSPHLVPQVS